MQLYTLTDNRYEVRQTVVQFPTDSAPLLDLASVDLSQ